MKSRDFLASLVIANHRLVIVLVLLLTLVVGSGASAVVVETSHDEFVGSTATSETNHYVKTNFRAGPRNTTVAVLIFERKYHILNPRAMEKLLRFQQRLLNDPRVAPTLADEHPPTGVPNVVSFVILQYVYGNQSDGSVEGGSGGGAFGGGGPATRIKSTSNITINPQPRPSIERQLRPFEETRWTYFSEFQRIAIKKLNSDATAPAGGVYAYVPKYYDHRYRRQAHGTVVYIYQREGLSNRELLESQTAMREIAEESFSDCEDCNERVYGRGIVNDELNRATIDSLLLVGPVAILLLVAVLWYVYRDAIDVLLTLFGVSVMLLWTFGFMGWAGIKFNQLFVAIPVFLMGLSIDYALHLFMRYREARAGEKRARIRQAMRTAVGGVGSAFVLVTLSTATGFASNVASPAAPIRELGAVATVGIVAAFVVFSALIPALKIEIDQALEARGCDRRKRALGTGTSKLNLVLRRCFWLADEIPWVVVGVAVLFASVSLVGATTLDTSFGKEDLTVEETPEYVESLPEPVRPHEYQTHDSLEFFRLNGFVNENNIAHVLVTGDVTTPGTLERINVAHEYAVNSTATLQFGSRENRIYNADLEPIGNGKSPVTVMQSVAATDEAFNQTFHSSDTDGNGVPDQNLEQVYDALYRTDPEAAETVLHREDGQYTAVRMAVYVNGTKSNQRVAEEMRATAAIIDDGGRGVTATATGQPVIRANVQQQLFETLLRSFALTLAIVAVILVVVYRWLRGSATLGMVTMVPVLFAVAWILGTMAALGFRFNVLTVLITSFTVGLGVDYSIHISERFSQELEKQPSVSEAVRISVLGTGGALLGSALTTAGGFGVLVFAILEPLQQFGVITALTIIYSLVGAVVVLPSLLVLWTRYRYWDE